MAHTTEPNPEAQIDVRVRLPESLHEAVVRKARQDDRTMAAFIRHALREATGAYVNGPG